MELENRDNVNEGKEKRSYVGEAAISFFLPIIGLIFYMMWNKSEPEKANACGKWAAIGLVFTIFAITVIGG